MPFIINNGVRIHYEVEGAGPALVLHHSFSRNVRLWRLAGNVDELAKAYRLVMIDARGHGESDKPHDATAYTAQAMVGDVVEVLDDLGVAKAAFFGVSMGGHVGLQTLRYAPERFAALVIMGFGRYGPRKDEALTLVARLRAGLQMAVEKGMEAYVSALERATGPMPPALRELALQNDPRALLAYLEGSVDWPSFDDLLPAATTPTLLIVSEGDPMFASAKAVAEHMPASTLLTLAGGGHNAESYSPSQTLPATLDFLKSHPWS